MSPARFNLLFSAALVPGTDPQQARQRLQDLFRLTDEVADRLFSGKLVAVKRDVDEETAARYRDRFRAAGALLQIVPVDLPAGPADSETEGAAPVDATAAPTNDDGSWSLAPPGAILSELGLLPAARPAAPDTSHLSLVAGDNWTFADCEPPRSAPPPPDTRHLRIEAIEPRPAAADESTI